MSWAMISVWALTFGLTVLADLTVAVQFGVILAALMFIRTVAATTTVSPVTQKYIEDGHPHNLQDKNIPECVSIFRVHGPFLFGATEKLFEITRCCMSKFSYYRRSEVDRNVELDLETLYKFGIGDMEIFLRR